MYVLKISNQHNTLDGELNKQTKTLLIIPNRTERHKLEFTLILQSLFNFESSCCLLKKF